MIFIIYIQVFPLKFGVNDFNPAFVFVRFHEFEILVSTR